jgi:copper chaperone CopZ
MTMRNTKTKTILFSGLLAILAPLSGLSQEPSKTAQSGTAKLQVTQCALKVSGMSRGGCAGMVEKSLLKLDRVTTAKVDYKTGDAQIEFDSKKTTPEKIVAGFNRANSGFRVEQSEPSRN